MTSGNVGIRGDSIVIDIPRWHPTSVNKLLRMHWAKRNRLVKAEYALIAGYARHAYLLWPAAGPEPPRRRVSVTFILKPKQRACDPDAQLKGLLDGLKRCGAIVDDNRKWIELATPEYERGTAELWGTRITLTDIESESVVMGRKAAMG